MPIKGSTLCLFFIATLSSFATATYVRADVEWLEPNKHVQYIAGLYKAQVTFLYRNTDSKPIRVVSAIPSCPCLTPVIEDSLLPPGSTAKLRVWIDVGDNIGDRTHSIAVAFQGLKHFTDEITLVISVVRPVTITPKVLLWRIAAPLDPKNFILVGGTSNMIRSVESIQLPPGFSVHTDRTGNNTFLFEILPPIVAKPTAGIFKWRAHLNDDSTIDMTGYALIR